jgi:CheY-like chemotaxis protein
MKFNILVVEDEEGVRKILVSLIEMIFMQEYPFLEFKVSSAPNGLKALSIVQSQKQDIIITDIMMPIMDGLEFMKKVRLFDKTVPILVLSALSDIQDIDRIMQSGANNYTAKPLNEKLFVAQIKVFVDFYLRRQKKYNHSAINLFTKNIFKRKTEFLIEREDDLIEFWEYIVTVFTDRYEIEKVLRFIYDFEMVLIKKGIDNSIFLEENPDECYFTLSETDKVSDKNEIYEMLKKHECSEKGYKFDGFFLSFMIRKKRDTPEESPESHMTPENRDAIERETRLLDIRYSVHEQVSPQEFLEELDPLIEDKIENFLDDLSLISTHIYDLENHDLATARENIRQITAHMEVFNEIVDTLGLFNVINRAFSNLIAFLSNLEDDVLRNGEKRMLLSKMLQGLCDDLNNWIVMLFIDKNGVDIHYFDASFSDNCYAIESTFSADDHPNEPKEDDEESLEFF